MKNKNTFFYILLFVIVLFAGFLRFYKVTGIPPSITWDEATVGYNAYTILHWGKDEYGKILPLTFKSFGDDKNPVHIYLTVPFVLIFGLNDFAVRASAAFFGVLNVLLIFYLARKLFKSDTAGLFSSFFLSISPFALQFSRFNHELNFAIFFAMLGFWLFLKGLENQKYLPYAFLAFGIDLLTYHSAKVVTFPLVLLLIVLNIKKLVKFKQYLFVGLTIYAFFVSLLFIKPELLGGARIKQNSVSEEEVFETQVYQKTNDKVLGLGEVVINRYKKYFDREFLFESGDSNPRHSIQTVGEFYSYDLLFLMIGLLGIIWRVFAKKNWNLLVIPVMLFLAPLPGAVSSEIPHAPRAMFMLLSWVLITSFGVSLVALFFKNKYLKILSGLIIVVLFYFPFSKYLKSYYDEYSQKYAIEWIYGMKQIMDFSNEYDFNRVYITDARMQPYIFALFYAKAPLPEFLETVKFNKTKSAPSNLVESFGKYRFMWDQIYTEPVDGVLYAITPNIYDGLFRKKDFDVLKLIKYPDGTDAYYLVTSSYR